MKHDAAITQLRLKAAHIAATDWPHADAWFKDLEHLALRAAADLVSCHDQTGIDLYAPSASSWLALVEHVLDHPLDEEIT